MFFCPVSGTMSGMCEVCSAIIVLSRAILDTCPCPSLPFSLSTFGVLIALFCLYNFVIKSLFHFFFSVTACLTLSCVILRVLSVNLN